MGVSAEQVLSTLKDLKDPSSGRPMSELGYFKHPGLLDGGAVRVRVELPTPASPHKARIEEAVRAHLSPLRLPRVEVAFGANVRPSPAKQHNPNDLVPSVKNVVLVGSGKGGVGKSTVSANVAVALANMGCKVGLLDADIYGPSMPLMMGLFGARPTSEDGKKVNPLTAFGVKVISIGFFVDPEQAMIWRGHMAPGAAEQAAGKLGVAFLGRVPINTAIRIGSDDGRPVVAADPGLPEAQALTRIAQNVADRVALANMTAVPHGQKPLVQLGRKA